jgi:hypothetical protein
MGMLDMPMSGDRTTPCRAECELAHTSQKNICGGKPIVIRTDDDAAGAVAFNGMKVEVSICLADLQAFRCGKKHLDRGGER